jgi:hypothetical protein
MRSRRIFRCLPWSPFSVAVRWEAVLLKAVLLKAVTASAVVLLAGCSDSKRESPAASAGASSLPPSGVSRSESAVQLTLDDVHEVLSGGAQLEVRELRPVVNLVVTTVFESKQDDLLEVHLAFEGVENAVGTHRSELGGQANSPAFAVAYLELISYVSQSGNLEVTLSGDGAISGQFAADLVVDEAGSSDPAGVPASAKDFSISGSFAGTWSLLCRSPVIGLPGDHNVADSPYCNNHQF